MLKAMFFIFRNFGYHGNRHKLRRIDRRPAFRIAPLILLLVIVFMFSQPRLGPFLFFLIPIVFFWFFAMMVSAFFRGVKRAAGSIEAFWNDHLDDETVEAVQEPLLDHRPLPSSVSLDVQLAALWQEAMTLAKEPLVSRPARSLLRQVHALADLYERFKQLLRTKLRTDELSYQRFLMAGTQGYEMIKGELQEAASRISHLQSISTSLRPTADEVAIRPESFQQIQREQLAKIDRLLSGTQDAVAQLVRVNFSIAEMRGVSSRKAGDISQAITQLKDLAQRAGHL